VEWADLLKVYGPLAIGWLVAAYLIKFILDRYSADIDARVKLAAALENLAKVVEGRGT
jgi:hypothetical protein